MKHLVNTPLKRLVHTEALLGSPLPDNLAQDALQAKYEALRELYSAALTRKALDEIQYRNDYDEIAKLKSELATTKAELNSLKPNVKPLF